jgi:hypothetical protein
MCVSIYICVCIYACVWSYMFLYIHSTYRSSFHIWEKTCELWFFFFFELGLLHLTWSSPVPAIYLQITWLHSSVWLNKMDLIFSLGERRNKCIICQQVTIKREEKHSQVIRKERVGLGESITFNKVGQSLWIRWYLISDLEKVG